MLLELKRFIKTETSTIGNLFVDGHFVCFILEDTDRGLTQDMSVEEILSHKVHGKTAIPAGTYKVVITHSERFQRLLPLLVNVPGFSGIRVHPGNKAVNTDGCLLPGLMHSADYVSNSRFAFNNLFEKLLEGEEITIKIS